MDSLLGFEEVLGENEEENLSTYSRKLVPWSTWNEWLFVSQSLFSDSPDSVAAALSRVSLLISAACLCSVVLTFEVALGPVTINSTMMNCCDQLWAPWTLHNAMYHSFLASELSIHFFFCCCCLDSNCLFSAFLLTFCDFEFRYQHGEAEDVFQLSLKLRHPLSKSNKRILTSCKLQFPVLTILFHGNIRCIFLLQQFFP